MILGGAIPRTIYLPFAPPTLSVGGMSRPSTDTIAALATPVGTSAIAVVRVSGPDCAALAQALFGPFPLVSPVTPTTVISAAIFWTMCSPRFIKAHGRIQAKIRWKSPFTEIHLSRNLF